ncbi:papaya proteinase 4-like [Triticum dicoccoides]|uniref:papaya proteinase 4-like n=1 Tax=Triticum dicoccoides TaxID=85692 RepID=UPI00188DE1F5|nr:papaya proteinase 4-like [Triticum dicoccoides]XP_037436546.1 papaya proteinase 4-like [Triticum dicoccoides]
MSLRRAVSFLLTRRLSSRVIPRTAPAGSFHSLGLPIGDGLRGAAGVAAAAAAFAGAGTLAVQYFRKGPNDDEPATRKKEQDIYIYKEEEMQERFANWMKRFNKTYRNEKEKAMRFQVFKETMTWIESQPPSSQKLMLPGNCFADLRSEELPCSQTCIGDLDDPDTKDYRENKFVTENVEGQAIVWKPVWPAVKQGGKQATQVSA